MQLIKLSNLLGLLSSLEVLIYTSEDDARLIPDNLKAGFPSHDDEEERNEGILSELGLNASKVTLRKLIAFVHRPAVKWGDIRPLCSELKDRLIDEAGEVPFFSLTPRELELYKKPRNGWESIITRFPKVADDIEEASKCFALARYAAVVFHSVQIIESGLIELGVFLKVKDPHSGWTAVSNALNAVIKKEHKRRTRFEKTNFAFLEQLQGTVEGLKNAWRNKISHVHGRLVLMTADFAPERAEEILYATRAFMHRLAEGLPEPKKGSSLEELLS